MKNVTISQEVLQTMIDNAVAQAVSTITAAPTVTKEKKTMKTKRVRKTWLSKLVCGTYSIADRATTRVVAEAVIVDAHLDATKTVRRAERKADKLEARQVAKLIRARGKEEAAQV